MHRNRIDAVVSHKSLQLNIHVSDIRCIESVSTPRYRISRCNELFTFPTFDVSELYRRRGIAYFFSAEHARFRMLMHRIRMDAEVSHKSLQGIIHVSRIRCIDLVSTPRYRLFLSTNYSRFWNSIHRNRVTVHDRIEYIGETHTFSNADASNSYNCWRWKN